jgi:tagaturonate reductase
MPATNGVSARPTLSRELIGAGARRRGEHTIALPRADVLDLPERAMQFGTGALLRGLVDFFIDAANARGQFGGRIVMVGSTGSGRDRRLNEQDGLYTLVEQGLVDGAARRDCRVIASVSRALAATSEWDVVLRAAESPALDLIFSNTTEVGIVLDEADAAAGADSGAERVLPRSFPAKLARVLLHRARHFQYDPARAPVVIPCELIEDNGDRLREIVTTLAERWKLEPELMSWLGRVAFCNTLVDRIVPGAPGPEQARELDEMLGYDDAMLTVCEPYRLLAIQGDAVLRTRLAFADADPGIIVAEDIAPYRERKVRLLNGAHTSFVSLALLAGCTTVREAVEHPVIGAFLRTVLFDEIVPSVSVPGAVKFAEEVVTRFANPYLHHALWDITLQGTAKLRVRLVPTIVAYASRTGQAPRALALGFAGFLAFQRGELHEKRLTSGGTVPPDAAGEAVRARWRSAQDADLPSFVRQVCQATELWGADLAAVPGFVDTVSEHLIRIRRDGAVAAMSVMVGAGV